jgi:hypothetical protein
VAGFVSVVVKFRDVVFPSSLATKTLCALFVVFKYTARTGDRMIRNNIGNGIEKMVLTCLQLLLCHFR